MYFYLQNAEYLTEIFLNFTCTPPIVLCIFFFNKKKIFIKNMRLQEKKKKSITIKKSIVGQVVFSFDCPLSLSFSLRSLCILIVYFSKLKPFCFVPTFSILYIFWLLIQKKKGREECH